jgi:deoxyribodipyrimidine photo-lyase
MSPSRALVWFKRDLRVRDHEPLVQALSHTDALALYLIEPDWLSSPECDASHVDFALSCVGELRQSLARLGLPLWVRVGPAVSVLSQLHQSLGFSHLLSHEETGPGWSYQRDIAVGQWCRSAGVTWREFTQTGVVRRLGSRSGWATRWQQRMDAPVQQVRSHFRAAAGEDILPFPTLTDLGLSAHHKTLQAAGEGAARQMLREFLQGRARGYRRGLSSPLTAQDACSRLSPHLAFGTLSMRTVHQAVERAMASAPDPDLARDLRAWSGRLRWHCHFMQKLESEPAVEFHNFSRVCDGLRESSFNQAHFAAWCEGRTGYPMVDACMRSLRATGWLNFRMRAMLVSFASYHLWLHWRETGLFLARQFLDFEPGIHWSQMQMQSGTTGINTLRMYSPAKQAREHDPQGLFIRHWVPELARVPLPFLAEPWTMPPSVEHLAGCVIGQDYPAPIVDEKSALQQAKERLYGLRRQDEARIQADAVQSRHGSRKSGLAPTVRRRGRATAAGPDSAQPDRVQGDLFAS